MKPKSILDRISDYYNIEHEKFEELGVLNSFINFDTPLFLNPKLLSETTILEFKSSKEKIIKHYEKTIILLKKTNFNDDYWKALKKHYSFPEPSGIGLGNSQNSTDGNGLTGEIAEKCLHTLKSIVDLDIEDPEIYKLLFLIQENVGVDRISDMLCRIIFDDLILYSNNMIEKLKIKDYKTDRNTNMKYLIRPNGKPIILIPADLLSEIPDVIDYSDIDSVIQINNQMKEYMCDFFGEAYLNLTKLRNIPNDKLKESILLNRDLIVSLLKKSEEKEVSVYDYTHDPMGIVNSIDYLRDFICESKIMEKEVKPESLKDFVGKMLIILKKCIEDLGLNNELYYIDTETNQYNLKKEVVSHRLFIIILETAKTLKLFDFSFEPKVGNGQVEFVIYNMVEKILVEFKLTTNDLVHGYDKQLPLYIKRYEATFTFYVIISVMRGSNINLFYERKTQNHSNCNIFEIDGNIQKSPSKI